MLVRRDALRAAGGFEAIRGSIIDDCALARILKRRGPIRLALSERVASIRSYSTTGDIRRMVVRSAYAQLSVTDLDRARWFWVDMLGLHVQYADEQTLCLRGTDELTHHSLVLRQGPVAALDHLGDTGAGSLATQGAIEEAVLDLLGASPDTQGSP